MAEAFIHHQELPMWQERANRGEIVISGMSWEDRGYRLLYTDTPRLAENLPECGVEERHIEAAPNSSHARRAVEADEQTRTASEKLATPTTLGDDQAPPCPLAAPAPVPAGTPPPESILVTCPDCQGQHPADQTCGICKKMAHIRELARKNRLEYHLMKKGQRAEAEGNE